MTFFFLIGSLSLSGAELNLIKLSNLLASKGHKIYIFSKKTFLLNIYLHSNIQIINLKKIKSYFKFIKNSTIIVYAYPMAYKLLLISLFFNLKIKIIIRHATYLNAFFEPFPKAGNIIHRLISFFLYNIAISFLFIFNYHIVLNNEMMVELRKRIFFKNKYIFVLQNLINDNLFDIDSNSNKIYQLAYIGRLIKEKGIYDYFSLLGKLNYNYSSLIIGNIPYDYKNINKGLKKIQSSQYFPFDSEFQTKYLPKIKLLVLPSYREGSPNVVIEALAMGIPVVAYDCKTGLKDLIIDSVNGFLVPTGNVSALSEKVKLSLNMKWDSNLIKKTVFSHRSEIVYDEFLRIIKFR
jgi:glycosyltransferase involved in cell wall biosynthesis